MAQKAAQDLFGGGLEGKRDIFVSVFELAGNVASGKKLNCPLQNFQHCQYLGCFELSVTDDT